VLSDDFCPDEASSAIPEMLTILEPMRDGGRAGVGPPWSSFEVPTMTGHEQT